MDGILVASVGTAEDECHTRPIGGFYETASRHGLKTDV